jgi:signal transduction histidine kinase
MQNFSQNVTIRILIMLIALLGGIGFFGYVLFNVSVANDNEERIVELQDVKTPILESLTLLKREIEQVQQSFSTAIVFENEFLLDDALRSSNNYSKHIYKISALDETTQPIVNTLQRDFTEYFTASKAIAIQLIAYPDQSRKYEKEIYDVNQMHNLILEKINLVIDDRKLDFIDSLAHTHREIVLANKLGASLGGLLILGLIILSWAITVTVIKAVNKSNQLKEVFMNTMSHELRTPINGISGALSLLKSTPLTEEQSELIEACKISEQAITTSVDDILEFSGMVSGTIKIAQHPFSLQAVITSTVKSFTIDCESKAISLTTVYDPSFNPLSTTVGDEQRLSHALRHIIGNAIKFSNSGQISIYVSSTPSNKVSDHGEITINVKDEGPGIPPGKLKDVFEPFQQIDGSFSRQHQGIGIGIPMSASIAKAMDGSLRICNRKDVGLEVVFTFCAKIINQALPLTPTTPVHIRGDINVLIVEDNEVNQLVLKSLIKKMGYQSMSAQNGLEAVNLIKEQSFSIILMDCQMPVMNGFDATKEIRRLQKGKPTPIIAVTANAMEGDRDRCLDAGMDDYLKKPVSMSRLRAAMNEHLFS